MYPRILFNRIIPPLRQLEELILIAVEENLPVSMQEQFRVQRKRINYVQRREGGREVAFYVIRDGRVTCDRTSSLPVVRREVRLAQVRLHQNAEERLATVYLVDGNLSSIEYDRSPSGFGRDVYTEVTVFDLPATIPRSSESRPRLPDWLQLYADQLEIASIEPPLRQAARLEMLEELDVSFPPDYLEFLERCDGALIGSLSLMGLAEAYESPIGEGEIVVIGQLDGKALIAVQKPGPKVVIVDLEDGQIKAMGESLKSAVEYLLSG